MDVISASNVIIFLHFLEGVEVTQKQKLYILHIISFTIITNQFRKQLLGGALENLELLEFQILYRDL